MEFSVIVPTRGKDRPILLNNCIRRISMQTVQPKRVIVIDRDPIIPQPDLVDRIREGLMQSDTEFNFIVEDDDYYDLRYFEWMCDFIKSHMDDKTTLYGVGETFYYHYPNRKYMRMEHSATHSSLFCTVIRKTPFFSFPEHLDNPFLDIVLWKNNTGIKTKFISHPMCIGIKGLSGSVFCGRGHQSTFPYPFHDNDLSWLKERIDDESFEFYKTFMR